MFTNINKLIQLIEDPDHPSLGVILPVLNFIGLWHPEPKSLKSRLKLIVLYIIYAFYFSQYVNCVINFNTESLKLILQYTPFHLGVAKACFFEKDYKYWEELIKFISCIERKQSIENDKEQDRISKNYIRWSRRVTYFFVVMAFFTNIAIFVEPYQKNHVTENEKVYLYMFEGYTPFSREPPGYYFSMAIQTVFGYLISICVVMWDMMTVTIMIFFVGQLRMSSLHCSRAIVVQSDTQSQRNIAACHEFHTKLVLFQKKFNALISPVMFIYLIVISVSLGLCIIQIAELEDDLPTMLSSCVYIGACLIQLLLFYWHSNAVTVESERVSYSTYESDWVDVDYKLQRQVALLALTTRKRLTFRAGPYNEMTLYTFLMILRSSYSFYTLLKETN